MLKVTEINQSISGKGRSQINAKIKCSEAISCIYEYLIYNNGDMLYCLADEARKTKFLCRK